MWTLLSIFFSGTTLILVPCINPLVPVTAAWFGGRGGRYQPDLFGNGLCYALGISLTSAILASSSALTGRYVESQPLCPLLLALVCTTLALLASSLAGWWGAEPSDSSLEPGKVPRSGRFISFILGGVLGIVALPATSPYLPDLNRWVESLASPTLAFLVFFTLSIGVAAPLVLLAVVSDRLTKLLRIEESRLWAKQLAAWIMIGSAVYILRPALPEVMALVVSIAVSLSAGLHLGWIYKGNDGLRPKKWIRVFVGVVWVAFAAYLFTTWVMQT